MRPTPTCGLRRLKVGCGQDCPPRIEYKLETDLPLRDLNALPPESMRIHGPGPGAEHCQCGSHSPECDVYPRIVGMREREIHLRYRHQHTCDRRRETNQQ